MVSTVFLYARLFENRHNFTVLSLLLEVFDSWFGHGNDVTSCPIVGEFVQTPATVWNNN